MLRRLSLLWKRFTPLEEQLLAGVRTVLPTATRSIFDAQVAAISRVQRLPPFWSEIAFYCLRSGKVDWSRVPSFPCTDELRLAEVRFRVAGADYRAVLSSVGGHIFDFTTIPGPRTVAFAAWDSAARSTLLGDPRRPPTGDRPSEVLPSTWRRVLDRHSGQEPGGWTLHGERTAHRVALADGEYLVLAERGGEEFILQRIDPPGDELLHLVGCDGQPAAIGQGLDRILGDDRTRSGTGVRG